jgi:hypothetical protein
MNHISTAALVLAVSTLTPAHATPQQNPGEAQKAAEAQGAKPAGAAPKAESPSGSKRGTPPTLLRIEVVLSRYQGEKKVASAPYGFLLTDDFDWVKVRMGVEVPVPVTTMAPNATTMPMMPMTSFQYRNVGTNIDCRAREGMGNGYFQLQLKVENSSVFTEGEGSGKASAESGGRLVRDAPLFRTFNISLNPVLRDGQSVQTVASTDPVTGEVVKIDLTLNVVK